MHSPSGQELMLNNDIRDKLNEIKKTIKIIVDLNNFLKTVDINDDNVELFKEVVETLKIYESAIRVINQSINNRLHPSKINLSKYYWNRSLEKAEVKEFP